MNEDERKTDFERAGEGQQLSIVREFLLFVVENKKWWLIPILIVLGLLGLFAALAPTGIAPFIYTVS